MAAVIAGRLVFAVLGSSGVPVSCPSLATTLIYAGLVASPADSSIQLAGRRIRLTSWPFAARA